MPRKNAVRSFEEDGIYHVFNRRIDRAPLFLHTADWHYFISLLDKYLSPHPANRSRNRTGANFAHEVELASYCLMGNHFHLMLKQKAKYGVSHLMNALSSNYARYFNRRYNRTGALCEPKFGCVPVRGEGQYAHLSRYIHLNPRKLTDRIIDYPYSSVRYYLGEKPPAWLKPKLGTDMKPAEYFEFLFEEANAA